jgi:ABC-2 type transport system ATP-binding protein
VPQGAAPDLTVTPWEHVYYYLRARDLGRGDALRRADQVLALLGLDGQRDKPAHRLSGGYQRRVLIAMCLAARARLLLLDEPTTALDPQVRRQTWELLDELRPHGAVLVTTHDMAEAETIADRIVLLAHGRVAAIGTAKQLIAALPAGLKIVVDAASGELRLPGARPQRVAGRCVVLPEEPGQLRDWVARLTDAGLAFSVEPCRLEDAYFHLLGETAA